MDAVSQVLLGRMTADDDASRMLGVSLLAHAALFAAVLLVPASWMGAQRAAPESVMVVSLAGPQGPQSGGRVAEGGRTVQQQPPLEAKPEPVRPPAAAAPEMVEPVKAPPKKTPPKAPPKVAPRETAPAAAPTTGAQPQRGDTVADTRGQGFGGLSSGGGGVGARLDVTNFCCPEYLATMQNRIREVWESRQASLGTTVVMFVIQRNGVMTDVAVERSSGNATLDLIATRAIRLARQLPPLPGEYPNPSLTVHVTFEYQR